MLSCDVYFGRFLDTKEGLAGRSCATVAMATLKSKQYIQHNGVRTKQSFCAFWFLWKHRVGAAGGKGLQDLQFAGQQSALGYPHK